MVIRVICAHIQQGKRSDYVLLCQSVTLLHLQSRFGYLGYRICNSHPQRPDDVVFATLWDDRSAVDSFIQAQKVNGVDWDAGTPLPWEVGVVVSTVISYVDDNYPSLITMARDVAPYVQRRSALPWTYRLTTAQWGLIASILDPVGARQKRRGRPRADSRTVFDAVFEVIARGLFWRQVPHGVSAATAWRYHDAWETSGALAQAWLILLPTLGSQARQDLVLDFLDCAHAPRRR